MESSQIGDLRSLDRMTGNESHLSASADEEMENQEKTSWILKSRRILQKVDWWYQIE